MNKNTKQKTQVEINMEINKLLQGGVRHIEEMLALITASDTSRTASRYHFFAKADGEWARPLSEKGFFSFEKKGIRDSNGYLLPEFMYMRRVAEQSPKEVAKIILSQKISEKSDVDLVNELIFICHKLPAEQIALLSEKIVTEKWLDIIFLDERRYSLYIIPIGQMMKKLREAGYFNKMFALFRNAVNASYINDDLHINMSYFEYILDPVFNDLDKGDLYRYSDFLINTFLENIKTSKDDFKGFSFWSKSSGLSFKQNILRRLSNLLVDCLKKNDNASIKKICANLLNSSTMNNPLLFRFSFFVFSMHKSLFAEEIRKMFLHLCENKNMDSFLESSRAATVDFEFMIKECFGVLSPKEREKCVEVLLDVHHKIQDTNKEQAEEMQERIMSHIFSVIKKHYGLNNKQEERVKSKGFKLIDDFEIWDQYPISDVKVRRVENRPPANPFFESFDTAPITEIVEKLKNEYNPKNIKEKIDITNKVGTERGYEGVGELLKGDIHNRIDEYIKHSTEFLDRDSIHPYYAYSFLEGVKIFLHKKESDQKSIDFSGILNCCHYIIALEEKKAVKGGDSWHDSDHWNWSNVYNVAVEIFKMSIRFCDSDFFKKERESIFMTIKNALSCGRRTTQEDLVESVGWVINAYAEAFDALTVFMHRESPDKISDDIKSECEKLLKDRKGASVWYRFGHYLKFFYVKDKSWVSGMLSDIFPKNQRDLYVAAWMGYLAQPDMNKEMFQDENIQKLYRDNVEIKEDKKYGFDPEERLSQHIALAYLYFSNFDFNHSLFIKFFSDASINARGNLINFIGDYFVRDKDFDQKIRKEDKKNIIEKINNLWDYLIENEDAKVLIKIGSWMDLSNNIFTKEDIIEKIYKTFKKTNGQIAESYFLDNVLFTLSSEYVERVFEIMKMYLKEKNTLSYYLDDNFLEIFKIFKESNKINKKELEQFVGYLLQKNPNHFFRLNELYE